MAISPINNVNNIRNLSFGENKEKPGTEKKSQISTQTKVIVGTGLAALAAVGIYIATRGHSKMPNIKAKAVPDIIEEGIDMGGSKYKTIKDGISGNCKERISYFDNGKEHFHTWYDSSIADIDKSVTKKMQYSENGDIFAITSYMSPGKESKYIQYCSSVDAQKYGHKIFTGQKYYPNGEKRFEIVQFPGFDIGTAKLYDINGELIKERTFRLPKGRKNNVSAN